MGAFGQFTLELGTGGGFTISKTPDGGFVVPYISSSKFSFLKFDSTASFQYGYQFPQTNVLKQGMQRHGKIITCTNSDNYYADFAKMDVATGAMELHKRIYGPSVSNGYFFAAVSDYILTQDSGFILALTPLACINTTGCDFGYVKLDKNLNFDHYLGQTNTAPHGGSVSSSQAIENPDGSITMAACEFQYGIGNVLIVSRSMGTTLLNDIGIHFGGAMGIFPSGITSHANQVIIAAHDNNDLILMGLPSNLSTVSWAYRYPGMYAYMPANYNQNFTWGPNNLYYGRIGSAVVTLSPNGQVHWAKIADGVTDIVPKLQINSRNMAAVYQAGNVVRLAIIDSIGAGLCTPSPTPITPVTLTPNIFNPTLTASLSAFSSSPLTPLVATNFSPVITTRCTAACSVAAAFTFSSTLLAAQFTNTSYGQGPTTYAWNFGDGGTSTQASPSHTYSGAGTYNVCLVISTGCGADTVCQPITINCSPQAVFTSSSTLLTAQFTDGSTAQAPTSYSWDFGDGGSSTLQNPSHTYAAAGTYTVCLIVNSACGSDTTCQPVTLTCPLPNSSFTATSALFNAQFTNGSTSQFTASYLWDFGDGATSTLQNPSHTYSTAGTYTVCLIANSACGSDTFCQPLTITCALPNSSFTATDSLYTAQFSNTSTSQATPNYVWDFGDGDTSTQANPSHVYSSAGTYNVCLITQSICGSDTFCDSITIVCDPATAAFTFSMQMLSVQFSSSVTGSGPITTVWTFGDGGTSTLTNPTHNYAAPGTYQVCLIAKGPCGEDTLCQSVTVACPPLVAAMGNTGNFPQIQFNDLSTGNPIAWMWDFGDGNSSTVQNPVHVYAAAGNYLVCLSIQDSCSEDSTCQTVNVAVGTASPMANSVHIFPNPATDQLHLQWDYVPLEPFLLQVYGGDGRMVYSGAMETSTWTMDTHAWATGVYWIRLRAGEIQITHKVVKAQ